MFENSYFVNDKSEFNLFWNTMKEKLPVVFRINKLIPNYEQFLNTISDKNVISRFIAQKKE